MENEDFEKTLDASRWDRENFAKALEGRNLNTEYWGDPVDALFGNFDDELTWKDGSQEVEDEWLTVAFVETESGDKFLVSRPGRMRKRDLAAELFLEDSDYFKSPSEFSFAEVKYYHFAGKG